MKDGSFEYYIESGENLRDIDFSALLVDLRMIEKNQTEEDKYRLINIKSIHQEKLDEVGLDVELVKDLNTTIAPEFNIEDAPKFLRYLQQLSDTTLNESQADFLSEVIASLEYQLECHYDVVSNNDNMIQFLGNLGKILNILSNLQFRKEDKKKGEDIAYIVKELYKVKKALDLRYLKQYLDIKKLGLMRKTSSVDSPSQWHLMIFKENKLKEYQANWNQAVSIVEALDKNPGADDFKKALIKRLQSHINYAIEDLMKNTRRNKFLDDKTLYSIIEKNEEIFERLNQLSRGNTK